MKTIFQDIIDKKIPAKILFENKRAIAFYDINPVEVGHFLVVPKVYSRNLIDIKTKEMIYLFRLARKLALKEMKKLNVNGFKIRVNNEAESGQEVFHTHIHVIPSPSRKNNML